MVIYSQFAGDDAGPTILRDYIQKIGGFTFSFKGRSQTVLTLAEAAAAVARLIVAALLQKREPRQPRIAVRKGGAPHALLSACTQKIEQSYRRQGITHFHDGVAVLTRRMTRQIESRVAL